MSENDEMIDYSPHERSLFDALPREAPVDGAGADAVLGQLRSEGLLASDRTPSARVQRRATLGFAAAAAVSGFLLGGALGPRTGGVAPEGTLEAQLERSDLRLDERLLLMQRAGSAYVRATNAYAAAARNVDPQAVEVATAVLVGAARAVGRTRLDGGLSDQIDAILTSAGVVSTPTSIIWY